MKNNSILKNRETTPIINIVSRTYKDKERFQYLSELGMSLHYSVNYARGKTSLIKFHKQRLGKQNYCLKTYRRYHVWERPLWRVFIQKDKGCLLKCH